MEYIALKGRADGIETHVITEIADYMTRIGLTIPDNYPFAGKRFNTTPASIQAGEHLPDDRIYSIMDTRGMLNRPRPSEAATNDARIESS